MTKRSIYKIPKLGDRQSKDVEALQDALRESGYDPGSTDGWFAKKTDAALNLFQTHHDYSVKGFVTPQTLVDLSIDFLQPPAQKGPRWLIVAKQWNGLGESNSKFVKFMSMQWLPVLGRHINTIVGAASAWCGLAIAVALTGAGVTGQLKDLHLELARNYAKYGQEVNWKRDGIPRGAIVHINHNADCKANSSNHVTFSNGDCAPQDILNMSQNEKGVWVYKVKPNAVFNGYGGNQGNKWQVAAYPVGDICEVRWPKEEVVEGKTIPLALPPPVLVSDGCTGKADSVGGSTQ